MDFEIIVNSVSAELLVEDSADEGVKKIADVIADDIESVCDKRPYIAAFTFECMFDRVIVFATVGKSAILSRLEENGIIDTSVIKDRRESFMIFECDFSAIDADRTGQVLVVAGSDKRGTIYGMFKISEAIGVTSLVYWGDSTPVKKTDVMLTKEWLLKDRAIKESSENIFISKQPSVEYRGFFINDEWPAFGGWSRDRFGGFNAKCYRELFIFLLRMRGNFLWPAMWSSVFSEDGPGIESARLADTLGIIMGTSHHEPLCRAGEEWQQIYKDYSESNAWNFINNKEGITNFWRDGLLRNKKFENLITIGMRGEADSKLLGEDATMADNIKVIKDAILTQHKLLKECVNEDLTKIPRVLAIYKEVEDYYYGDETCEGLKDWDELKDVIFLLSDDNWANTRGLPKEEEREHPGGYGMYYHFDYHGGPISYEWQNTSRLSK
ncbi:MAG: glycosyl hydrolase 115 family protein, partial [Lachnospiraceae bacterium]|nr:glycosyl hydrolase 115 family protein [Lachnospiraceae bacterium]